MDRVTGESTSHRTRLFGHTWELTTDRLEFHLETTDPRSAKFFLDVRLRGTPEDCARWTNGLVDALLAADILYLVSRVALDEHDQELEEEVTYVHPEFEARYRPRTD